MLRIIMEIPTLIVTSLHIEHVVPSLHGHGVRFDVHAVDAESREYDIEMQCAHEYTMLQLVKRARFNSSMMDTAGFRKGMSYEKLGETYVVIIAEEDVLGYDLPIYHIGRFIEENTQRFPDDSHIIFVNCVYQGSEDTPLSRLTHDLLARDPEKMNEGPLKETAMRFKERKAGEKEMAAPYQELIKKFREEDRAEARAEGREEGREEGRAESTRHSIRMLMKNTGATAEKAMEMLGIDRGEWRKYLAVL